MCNTVSDCAKLYSVLAGPDNTKESEITQFQPKVKIPTTLKVSLKGIRVGVDPKWSGVADETILAQFNETVAWLANSGENGNIFFWKKYFFNENFRLRSY